MLLVSQSMEDTSSSLATVVSLFPISGLPVFDVYLQTLLLIRMSLQTQGYQSYPCRHHQWPGKRATNYSSYFMVH